MNAQQTTKTVTNNTESTNLTIPSWLIGLYEKSGIANIRITPTN